MAQAQRSEARLRRKIRIRKSIFGTTARPRLSVFKSSKYIYAQVVDDSAQQTLVACSSAEKALRKTLKSARSIEASQAVGKELATRAKNKKIVDVVFDRGGYGYHGRIKALADGAREAGLNF